MQNLSTRHTPLSKHTTTKLSTEMAFGHSRYTDASHGTFTDIGHDQNFNGPVQVQIAQANVYISVFGPRHPKHTSALRLTKNSNFGVSTTRSSTSTLISALILSLSNDVDRVIDIATCLVVQIVNLLVSPETRELEQHNLDKHNSLRLELDALHQSLVLLGITVREYQCHGRPLGQSLIDAVKPVVTRCRGLLEELFENVNGGFRRRSHGQGGFWPPAFSRTRDGGQDTKLALLRAQLSECRELLREFVVAVDSYVLFCFPRWMTSTEI